MHDVEQPHDFAHPATDHGQRRSGFDRRAAAFDLQEGEGDRGQHDVMHPARIRAAFEVIEAEVVFECPILLFDRPTAARERDEVDQGGRRRQMEQIVFPLVGGRAFAEQPSVPASLSSGGPATRRTVRSAGRRCRCPRSRPPTRHRGRTARWRSRIASRVRRRPRMTRPRESPRHTRGRSVPGRRGTARYCRSRHRPRRP